MNQYIAELLEELSQITVTYILRGYIWRPTELERLDKIKQELEANNYTLSHCEMNIRARRYLTGIKAKPASERIQ